MLKGKMFPIAFVLLFMSVFPYLHHFRYNNDLMPEKLFDPSMFTEAHFDSYQNSVNIITNKVVTNGNQLLGTALFFIPRSYWESKSIGSGHVLADAIEYDGFSNVAVSYFAEGYINFGYLGMFLFTLILAFVNATFDYKYWFKYNESSLMFKTSYLIFIPFLFFILRGSLLASVANFLGYIICLILLFFIIRKFSKFKYITKTS
ncbi:O-antigen polysaccharide polymerase Wzy [Olleya sp. R77988]|uniref:O-antigen polysaccharide polymerase Wzy n=1 Tax=Olleya sp. R77988 TaxID=3093875 RepID=UPI0037CA82F0